MRSRSIQKARNSILEGKSKEVWILSRCPVANLMETHGAYAAARRRMQWLKWKRWYEVARLIRKILEHDYICVAFSWGLTNLFKWRRVPNCWCSIELHWIEAYPNPMCERDACQLQKLTTFCSNETFWKLKNFIKSQNVQIDLNFEHTPPGRLITYE